MTTNVQRARARILLTIRQNSRALLFAGGWILAGAFLFILVSHARALDALLLAVCIERAPGVWGRVYDAITEVGVFGVVASIVMTNVTRKYRPEWTSRAIAREASDHVVVLGYTHLGQRIRDTAVSSNVPVVVADANASAIESLIEREEPAIIGSARDKETIEAAAVSRAKVVVIATDDLEEAAVGARLVRQANSSCELVIRCSDDDVGEVLAKTHRARVLSTSKLAAEHITAQALRTSIQSALVIGKNNVGKRVALALSSKGIATTFIEETEDARELARAEGMQLVVLADDHLGKNLVRVDRIRDVNPHCTIVCRVFDEDAGEILAQRPFRCMVLSTSRLAANALVSAGVFHKLDRDVKTIRARVARAA